ncbi:MAG TPA: aminotransferase class V-fold PLP-dependent enzyme [Solirubrobacteraceae bacterium]
MAVGPSIAPGVPVLEAQELWSPAGTYLNTASYGLPPKPGWDALQTALADWHAGRTSWEGWGAATEGSRRAFAGIVDVDPSHVAVGATVSGFVGLIAGSLPDGARVLAPEIEFTSNLFPYLAQAHRGITVRTVPAADLVASIDETVDLVAFSAVQMATGEVADIAGITAAARRERALTVCDATQAAGWLPVCAGDFDFLVASAYKWLMCPRGVAFLTVRPSRLASIVPASAGWFAGEDVHASYFGPPLRLAGDARRLDTSPAWFSWVGAEPTLELLEAIGIDAVHAHDVGLANHFREGLGLPSGNSAIVSLDRPGAELALDAAGIRAAVRGGRLRVSWHLYNTDRDVEIALDALS